MEDDELKFVITDNIVEKLTLKWDGTRFALVHIHGSGVGFMSVIPLNPREAHDAAKWITEVETKVFHEGGRNGG